MNVGCVEPRLPLRRRRSAPDGQSLVEYVLVLSLVAVVIIAVVIQVGRRTAGALCQVSGGLNPTPTEQCLFAGAGPLYMLNDGGTTTIANDSSTRHLQGAYVGTQGTSYMLGQPGPGRSAGAVTLDGVSGAVSSPYIQTSLTAYSAAIWFNTATKLFPGNDLGEALITDRGDPSSGSCALTLGLRGPSGGVIGDVFFALDADGIFIGRESTGTYNDGAWHYAVGTWAATAGTPVTPSQFHLYIDGQEVGAIDHAIGTKNSPLNGSGPTLIGREPAWNDNHIAGSLAQAAIYDQVVIPPEVVLAQYRAGLQS